MTVWTDLPEEVKGLILDIHFHGNVVRYGAPPKVSRGLDKHKSFREIPLFFVSKTFLERDAIVGAMLRSTTLLVDDIDNLSKVQAVLKPGQLQLVRKIQTTFQYMCNKGVIDVKSCSFGPQTFKDVFASLSQLDIKIILPPKVNFPVVTVSERQVGMYGLWGARLASRIPIQPLAQSAGDDTSKQADTDFELRETARMDVFFEGLRGSAMYFLECLLIEGRHPWAYDTVWFNLVKKQQTSTNVKVQLLIDTHVRVAPRPTDHWGPIGSKCLQSKLQQACVNLTDRLLKFHIDGSEIGVPQFFSNKFLEYEDWVRRSNARLFV